MNRIADTGDYYIEVSPGYIVVNVHANDIDSLIANLLEAKQSIEDSREVYEAGINGKKS